MAKKQRWWMMAVFGLLACFFIVSTSAQAVPINSIKKGVRAKLGVNEDLYDVISTTYQGEEITLILIYINDRTLNSKLDPKIKSDMRKYVDKNALFISAISTAKETNFYPHAIRVHQGGETFSVNSVHAITSDFKHGAMPESMNVMGRKLWGSKGIVSFSKNVDPSSGFSVEYGSTNATLKPTSPRGPSKPKPVDERAPALSNDKEKTQDLRQEPNQREQFNTSERSGNPAGSQTQRECNNCGQGGRQGAFLLTSFVNLVLVSLTLLM